MNNFSARNVTKNRLVLGVIALAIVIFLVLLVKGWGGRVNNGIDGTVTITGSFSCLPYENGKEGECTLGVRGHDNEYYALDVSRIQDANTDLKAEDRIAVTGFLIPPDEVSDEWEKYDIKAVIKVNTLLRTR